MATSEILRERWCKLSEPSWEKKTYKASSTKEVVKRVKSCFKILFQKRIATLRILFRISSLGTATSIVLNTESFILCLYKMFDGVSYLCKASTKQMGNSWTKAYTTTSFHQSNRERDGRSRKYMEEQFNE